MRSLFFDLDGTLTDGGEGIIKCIQYALETLGETVPDTTDLTWTVGPPLWDSFRELLREPTEARVEAAVEAYRHRFKDVGIYENKLYHGIAPCLQELARRGIPLYVVTSKPRVLAQRVVEHFGLTQHFRRVHGPELDDKTSQKADLIGAVLEGEGIEAGKTWMVGDRRHDVEGAKHHGVFAVGASWGYGAPGELVAAGADLVVASPQELVGNMSDCLPVSESREEL